MKPHRPGLGARALLFARTARQLRPSQWWHRALRTGRSSSPGGAVVFVPSPDRVAPLRGALLGWHAAPDSAMQQRAAAVRAGRYRFVGIERILDRPDFRTRDVSHLWSYNLQYFDYARDVAATAPDDPEAAQWFAQLADAWIEQTERGAADAWAPYPVSLRTVNWIYARLLFGDALDPAAAARIDASIARQLLHLEHNLERDILANHFQKNLKALVIGGLYFGGEDAARWLKRGTKELWREVFEQVLPDGVQYERSPMYHAIALGDFLEVIDLLRCVQRVVPPQVQARVRAMVRATGVLARPDGTLHLFNDAANGIAPGLAWLDHMSRHVLDEPIPQPQGHVTLPHAGHHAWIDDAAGERLLVDCGEPGPRYQPGHAHCDMLSYELDLHGAPFVVDSGVCGYDGDPLREYVRSTRAHNTVVIGGREQSEVWSTFRMARRASVAYGESAAPDGHFHFRGGCRPFHSGCTHHRTIEKLGSWRVSDHVEGALGVPLESWIHLHPDCTVELRERCICVRRPQGDVLIEPFGVDAFDVVQGEMTPPQGWYCPGFGRSIAAPAIRLLVRANDGHEFGYTINAMKR